MPGHGNGYHTEWGEPKESDMSAVVMKPMAPNGARAREALEAKIAELEAKPQEDNISDREKLDALADAREQARSDTQAKLDAEATAVVSANVAGRKYVPGERQAIPQPNPDPSYTVPDTACQDFLDDVKVKEDKKKATNPKDAVGTGKVPMSVVSQPVLSELALAMLEGSRKYGRHNYREAGVRGSVYFDAVARHMMAWWEGEDIDPDSGLSHVTKAIASLTVLRDSMIRENWVDDRPPKTDQKWLAEMNEKARAIVERYPNCVDPITEL